MNKLTKEEIRTLRKGDVITLDGYNEDQVVDRMGLWPGGGYICFRGMKDGLALSQVYNLNAKLSSSVPRDLHYC